MRDMGTVIDVVAEAIWENVSIHFFFFFNFQPFSTAFFVYFTLPFLSLAA